MEIQTTVEVTHLPKDLAIERRRDRERTRGALAIITGGTFAACSLLTVIGGLIGRFDAQLVSAVMTALGSASVAGSWFYFRPRAKDSHRLVTK